MKNISTDIKLNDARIGLLGGTFDPIHKGHILIGEQSQKKLNLTELWLVPCKRNVLKQNSPVIANHHRLAMLQLVVDQHPHWRLDDREIDRQGPSYTVETLKEIRLAWAKNHKTPLLLYLLISSDVFMQLNAWHHWQELLNWAHIIILPRPGYAYQLHHDIQQFLKIHQTTDITLLNQNQTGYIYTLQISNQTTICGSVIRRDLYASQDVSAFLMPQVWDYIQRHQLYKKSFVR